MQLMLLMPIEYSMAGTKDWRKNNLQITFKNLFYIFYHDTNSIDSILNAICFYI